MSRRGRWMTLNVSPLLVLLAAAAAASLMLTSAAEVGVDCTSGAVSSPSPPLPPRQQQLLDQQRFREKVQSVDLIFTATIKHLNAGVTRASVAVKRTLKGYITRDRNGFRSDITVDSVTSPCGRKVTVGDTWIFFANVSGSSYSRPKYEQVGALMRITVNNIKRTDAMVKNITFVAEELPKKDIPKRKDPCLTKYCIYGSTCKSNEDGTADCICDNICDEVYAPVCGSDNVTYTNHCQLKVSSCEQQQKIRIVSNKECAGKTDPCLGKKCSFGAKCVADQNGEGATCKCNNQCYDLGSHSKSSAVCGSDGKDYKTVCELDREACRRMKNITVAYKGHCDACLDFECPVPGVCHTTDEDHPKPFCDCTELCSLTTKPVCSMNNKTYLNECVYRMHQCKLKLKVEIQKYTECSYVGSPCDNLKCKHGLICIVDRNTKAKCTCPTYCKKNLDPVCGDDGRQYSNHCEMIRLNCKNGKTSVSLKNKGKCAQAICQVHQCQQGAECEERQGKAHCKCKRCLHTKSMPVCGNDGNTYDNYCILQLYNCENRLTIVVKHQGQCDPCLKKSCQLYSTCEVREMEAICVCPQICTMDHNPVCGNDGQVYSNLCSLQVKSCDIGLDLAVGATQQCDKECLGINCKYYSKCHQGKCLCSEECTSSYVPVCGSDSKTYSNGCELRKSSCEKEQSLTIKHAGTCKKTNNDAEESEGPDDSEGSSMESSGMLSECLVNCKFGGECILDSNNVAMKCACNMKCAEVSSGKICGSNGVFYDNVCSLKQAECTHQVSIEIISNPRFCKEEDGPCSASEFGCCRDGETTALGKNRSGCSELCLCNTLGSLGSTCDPITGRCKCKPNVDGLKCDRCKIGFFGLSLIAKGEEGCQACGCDIYGSARDDCEQTNGVCTCLQGIRGVKCELCEDGKPYGATRGNCDKDRNIILQDDNSCLGKICPTDSKCVLNHQTGIAKCVCNVKCETRKSNTRRVCASNGIVYANTCELRRAACRTNIDAQSSTALSVLHRVSDDKCGLVTRLDNEIKDDSNQGYSFSGKSFLKLKKLAASSKLCNFRLRLRFHDVDNDMLLFSLQGGDTADESAFNDFIEANLINGYLVVSYNVGDGVETLTYTRMRFYSAVEYYVQINLVRNRLTVTVDNNTPMLHNSKYNISSTLNINNNIFIGGKFSTALQLSKTSKSQEKYWFKGCLFLFTYRINQITYDFTQEIETQSNIERTCEMNVVSGSSCHANTCGHGGDCSTNPADGVVVCTCVQPYHGPRCQYGSATPSYHGFNSQYSTLRLPEGFFDNFDVQLWFSTRKSEEGVLLYSGQKSNPVNGDFFCVNLENRRIVVSMNAGSGIFKIKSDTIIELKSWYILHVWRDNKGADRISMTINQGIKKSYNDKLSANISSIRLEGKYRVFNLPNSMFLGGVYGLSPKHNKIMPINHNANIKRNFNGIIQRVYIGGKLITSYNNTDSVMDAGPYLCKNSKCMTESICRPFLNHRLCQCDLSPPIHSTNKCISSVFPRNSKNTSIFLDGNSFYKYDYRDTKNDISSRRRLALYKNSVEITLSAIASPSLTPTTLLQLGDLDEDFMKIEVTLRGHIRLSVNLGTNTLVMKSKNSILNNQHWNEIIYKRDKKKSTLIVNGSTISSISSGKSTQLNTDSVFVLGSQKTEHSKGFMGCISHIVIDSRLINFADVKEGKGITSCQHAMN